MICLNAFHVDKKKLRWPALDMHQGIIEKNRDLSENVGERPPWALVLGRACF